MIHILMVSDEHHSELGVSDEEVLGWLMADLDWINKLIKNREVYR
jgi:hypothetical protein